MNRGPTLRIGAIGQDVFRLQRLLVELKLLTFDQIDGAFGAPTESAVKDFQQGSGLTTDGIVGTQTWSGLPADPHTPCLSLGATGNSLSALQKFSRRMQHKIRPLTRDRLMACLVTEPKLPCALINLTAGSEWMASWGIVHDGCRRARLERPWRRFPGSLQRSGTERCCVRTLEPLPQCRPREIGANPQPKRKALKA
jgi:Putative peptidoglycan binding domain